MRLLRLAPVLLLAFSAACGGSHEAASHEAKAGAVEQPVPTPDTTPVKALRTPAGLVLKPGEAPSAVTPAPGAEK
jgi:hypothetical protein